MSRGAPGVRYMDGASKARVERGFYLVHGQQMTDFDFAVMSDEDTRGYIEYARQYAAQSGQPEVVLTPAVAPVSDVFQGPVAPVYDMSPEAANAPLSDLVQSISGQPAWVEGAGRPVRQAVSARAMHARPSALQSNPDTFQEQLEQAPLPQSRQGFFTSLRRMERKAVAIAGSAAVALIAVSAVSVFALGGGDKPQSARHDGDTNLTSASTSSQQVQQEAQPTLDTQSQNSEPVQNSPVNQTGAIAQVPASSKPKSSVPSNPTPPPITDNTTVNNPTDQSSGDQQGGGTADQGGGTNPQGNGQTEDNGTGNGGTGTSTENGNQTGSGQGSGQSGTQDSTKEPL